MGVLSTPGIIIYHATDSFNYNMRISVFGFNVISARL